MREDTAPPQPAVNKSRFTASSRSTIAATSNIDRCTRGCEERPFQQNHVTIKHSDLTEPNATQRLIAIVCIVAAIVLVGIVVASSRARRNRVSNDAQSLASAIPDFRRIVEASSKSPESARFNKRYMRGKCVILEASTWRIDAIYHDLSPDLRAERRSDVGTIVLITRGERHVGVYVTPGGGSVVRDAIVQTLHADVYDAVLERKVAEYDFQGSPPPDRIRTRPGERSDVSGGEVHQLVLNTLRDLKRLPVPAL